MHDHVAEVEMFNTLSYTKKLEAVGLSRAQAEAHIQIMADIIETNLATKQDLKDLEYRLIIRLTAIIGGMMTLSISVIALIGKF